MNSQMYCLKCKKQTDTNNIIEAVSKNNRKMLKGICNICGSKKSRFIPMQNNKINVSKTQMKRTNDSFVKQLDLTNHDLEQLAKIENKIQKQGSGLFLSPVKNYEGGFLPLAALIPLIGGIVSGIGGAAAGISSAVNSTKQTAEQERHNREIEKMAREQTGSGCKSKKKCGSGIFLGPPQV